MPITVASSQKYAHSSTLRAFGAAGAQRRHVGQVRRSSMIFMVSLGRIMLIVLVALLAGCAATKQARSMEKSGFLGDLYPLMHEGAQGEALLIYKNPRVAEIPRGTYKKMLLEPVTIWGPAAADHNESRQKDLHRVADLLYGLAYDSLSKDYEI